jgi:hypothetical protein
MKSSAVSVWSVWVLERPDKVPILPSGFPVENENGAAVAWSASPSKALEATAEARIFIVLFFIHYVLFDDFV